jgi:hypothetical protein
MSTEGGATEAEECQALKDKGGDVDVAMSTLSDPNSNKPEHSIDEAFSEPSVELPSSDMAAGTCRRGMILRYYFTYTKQVISFSTHRLFQLSFYCGGRRTYSSTGVFNGTRSLCSYWSRISFVQ